VKEANFEAEKKIKQKRKISFPTLLFMCYGIFPTRNGSKSTIATQKSDNVKGLTLLLPC
jgi:hypothetical protein